MTKGKFDADNWILVIAKEIKRLRIEGGYRSYEAFALDNGLDRKQYWRVEKGLNLTIKTLIKILSIYNLDLIDFFKGIELNLNQAESKPSSKRRPLKKQ